MIGHPSLHALASILLASAMFYGFARGKARVEIVSLMTIGAIALGLYFFPLPGSAPSDGLVLAFGGFGHHALITICALMILGRGLVVTGALDPAARALNHLWRLNQQLGLLVTLIIALFMSMIINDTPVLVLLLPILAQLAHKGEMPASKTLIPVNSAILIGGMATTIGTSTNLLVVSIAIDLGMKPIGVFHYTDIVLIAALLALPYIRMVMPRLLPDNSPETGPELRRYCATVRLGAETAAFGKSGEQIRALLPTGIRLDSPFTGPATPGMRLSIFDGSTESNVAVMTSGVHPIVDQMADGRWLVAGSRAQADDKNGRIHAVDGRLEHEMILGDGIENLLCSADGTVWVGYFDEGIFGGPKKDGRWPVSSGGIVQFDAVGRQLWSFNEQVREPYSIADCYAMTLSGTDLWACFYTDFPIARISGGKPVFWSNGVTGAKAIAVKDDIVMLAGGYREDANRITLVTLDGTSSRELGSFRCGHEKRSAANLLQGRGSIIHIVSDGVWSRVPIDKAAEAVSKMRDQR